MKAVEPTGGLDEIGNLSKSISDVKKPTASGGAPGIKKSLDYFNGNTNLVVRLKGAGHILNYNRMGMNIQNTERG